jgi:pimeloyl-ACP methyl ester carboxylesterase
MASSEETATRPGAYVDAGGVHTYYEVYGAGEPLLLLTGGMCTAETFDGQTPALAEHYQVYVVERRGQGRTPDVDGPITYENMAADTIAFMEALGIESAHLVGWSDGALVGLLVALQRPALVRKLVFIGQYVNFEGADPEKMALMDQLMRPEAFPPMLKQMYAATSPDGPDHFDVVFEKLAPLWQGDPGIDLDQLAGVQAPTLVLLGDDDVVSVEHAAALQDAFPSCQVGVVPGASHALPMEKPEHTNRLILDFLATEQVPKMFGTEELQKLSRSGGA